MGAQSSRFAFVRCAELGRAFLERRDRADRDVLSVEELEPGCERLRSEDLRERVAELVLGGRVVLPLDKILAPDELAQAAEELLLERADGEPPAVGGRVDPVAGGAAGEQARHWVSVHAVRREAVGAVSHRELDPATAPGAFAREQRREDLGDRSERAGGEIGHLYRG